MRFEFPASRLVTHRFFKIVIAAGHLEAGFDQKCSEDIHQYGCGALERRADLISTPPSNEDSDDGTVPAFVPESVVAYRSTDKVATD